MMVTFVSECEKKALPRTRRVLDSFADRIGQNTWQTIITEEGLIAVKKLLRKTVTKNTAVACHWIRSRSRTELLWVVGNRRKFNEEGQVPVHATQKNHLHTEWENNWVYLPALKALVGLAALLHDWGKANALFQEKLRISTQKGDPLRHEWLSVVIIKALVDLSGDTEKDEAWLALLARGEIDEAALLANISKALPNPLHELPPIAQMIAWLILSHHRLPFLQEACQDKYKEQEQKSLKSMLKSVTAKWGYQNLYDEKDQKRKEKCFSFPEGLLTKSGPWMKKVKRFANALKQEEGKIQEAQNQGALRLLLLYARLALMLGDHFYSSCDKPKNELKTCDLYANTDEKKALKQSLEDHLLGGLS